MRALKTRATRVTLASKTTKQVKKEVPDQMTIDLMETLFGEIRFE